MGPEEFDEDDEAQVAANRKRVLLPIFGESRMDRARRLIVDDPGFSAYLRNRDEGLWWEIDGDEGFDTVHHTFDWLYGYCGLADPEEPYACEDCEDQDVCDDRRNEGANEPLLQCPRVDYLETLYEHRDRLATAIDGFVRRKLRDYGVRGNPPVEHKCAEIPGLPWVTRSGVYVIELQPGVVKIGVAKSIKDRVSSAQTYQPHPVKLLAWFDGDRSVEHSMHKRFSAYRINPRLELFRLSGELLETVRARHQELRKSA